MQFTALLTATALLFTTVSSLGINCRGSFQCGPVLDPVAKDLVGFINNIDTNRFYNNGDHIACDGIFCAFLQNTSGANGGAIKNLAHYITDHKCTVCGSVPTGFPNGDNDVSHGQLTFNAADGAGCQGLC